MDVKIKLVPFNEEDEGLFNQAYVELYRLRELTGRENLAPMLEVLSRLHGNLRFAATYVVSADEEVAEVEA